jgi:hypothetical protein
MSKFQRGLRSSATATRRSGETDTIVSRSYSTRIVVASHAGRIAPSAAEVYRARRQAADADSGAPGGPARPVNCGPRPNALSVFMTSNEDGVVPASGL